jgi:hypothetical protein
VTREEFDALVKSLDRLGLGTSGGDAVNAKRCSAHVSSLGPSLLGSTLIPL